MILYMCELKFRTIMIPLPSETKEVMPITKNALIRLKYLDRLLSDRHHYYDRKTLTEKVNEMLDADGFKTVDKRTIEMDIIDLMDAPFNAPIMEFKVDG